MKISYILGAVYSLGIIGVGVGGFIMGDYMLPQIVWSSIAVLGAGLVLGTFTIEKNMDLIKRYVASKQEPMESTLQEVNVPQQPQPVSTPTFQPIQEPIQQPLQEPQPIAQPIAEPQPLHQNPTETKIATYIVEMMQKGYDLQNIMDALKKGGYDEEVINSTLQRLVDSGVIQLKQPEPTRDELVQQKIKELDRQVEEGRKAMAKNEPEPEKEDELEFEEEPEEYKPSHKSKKDIKPSKEKYICPICLHNCKTRGGYEKHFWDEHTSSVRKKELAKKEGKNAEANN